MIKKIAFITLFIGIGFSQSTSTLSLFQAIDLAKQKSLNIKSIDLDYEVRIQSYRVAKSNLLFNLNLNGSIPGLNRQINSITQPNGTILFVPTSQAFSNVNLMINQPIPVLGGSFWIGSSLARFDNFNDNSYFWNAQPMFLGLSLPLGSFNRNKWDWKNAKLDYRKSHSDYAEALEQLSIDITNAYFDFYIAKIQLENAMYNVSINDSIFRISEGRYNVGKIGENELLQVKLSKINAEQDVNRLQLQTAIAEQRLSLLIGLNVNEKITLDTLPHVINMSVDMTQAIAEGKENSSLIIQNQINLLNNLADMKQASRNRFIDGTLTATFGLNQTDPSLLNAYQNPLNSQTASIGFTMPIFNFGNAQSNYKLNKARYESSVARTDFLDKNFEITIQENVLTYKTLEGNVETAKLGYEISKRRFDVSKNRFMIGKIDITDLTIAQGEKDNSLINYMNVLRNYWVAYFQLRKSTLYDFVKNEKLIFTKK